MSFWDLANGKKSELTPPVDASPQLQTAMGVAGAALVTAATAAAVLYAPSASNVGMFLNHGFRGTSRSLKAGEDGRNLVLQQNEENARRRRELGLSYLEGIASNTTPSANLLCRLARARFATGRVNGALSAAEEAIGVDPQNEQAKLLVIYYLIRLRRTDEAVALLGAIAPKGQHAWLLNGIAELLSQQGLDGHALRCWKWATDCEPGDVGAWEKQAFFHEARLNWTEASLCYEKASTLDPSRPKPWEVAYRNGLNFFSQGKTQDALTLLQRANDFKPSWLEPLMQRAIIYAREKQYEQALMMLREVFRVEPAHAQAHLLAGNVQHYRGEHREAQEHWESAFKSDERSPVPWVVEVTAARESLVERKFEQAILHLDSAKQIYDSWSVVGELYAEIERKMEAERLAAAGDQYFRDQNLQAAIEFWEKSAEMDGSVSDTFLKIGAVHADAGETGRARTFFLKALALNHDRAQEALNLCDSYHEFIPEIGPL